MKGIVLNVPVTANMYSLHGQFAFSYSDCLLYFPYFLLILVTAEQTTDIQTNLFGAGPDVVLENEVNAHLCLLLSFLKVEYSE